MKKLIIFFVLFLASAIGAMEEYPSLEQAVESGKTQNDAKESFLDLGLPIEILEKCFEHANYQTAQEIIAQITRIEEEQLILTDQDSRYLDDPELCQIAEIIQNMPLQAHTRVALYIASTNNFSFCERLHFLSMMCLNKNSTEKQKIILLFLLEYIDEKDPNFMLATKLIKETEAAKIIINFLSKNNRK